MFYHFLLQISEEKFVLKRVASNETKKNTEKEKFCLSDPVSKLQQTYPIDKTESTSLFLNLTFVLSHGKR